MHSAIYEGKVRHRRFSPVQNTFQYRLFLMYVDLSELPTLFEGRWFWSSRKVNLAYLRRRDHLGDPLVLTHFRYFGHCFNPVSFYFCYDREDHRVETIVAEIHNTPWGEEHCYVLDEALNEHPSPDWRRYRFSKAFHVSPFMEMEIHYDWRFRVPGETIQVHFINMTQEGRRRFDATLSLRRREMSGPALALSLLLHPLMTVKVTTMIYWQALRLLIKGAPIHVHPAKRRRT